MISPVTLLLALSAPVFMAVAYLTLLTLLSGAPSRPAPPRRAQRFTILIPAHDEAGRIAKVIGQLEQLDWPRTQWRVLVVADNCRDDTAQRATAAGASVLVRHDAERIGKGYALEFGFVELLKDGWTEAVVVVDADSEVSANLLSACAARLEQGAESVQVFLGVANPDTSWRTRLMAIALAIFHRLRSRGRERLGLSCGLRGNGMCFTRALLERQPHRAYSMVEDVEYGIQLGFAGVRVHYADEAQVLAEIPSSARSAESQRQRWEGGRSRHARRHGLPLLRAALFRRSSVLLDLAIDVLLPPLALVGAGLLLVLAAALASWAMGMVPAWALLPALFASVLLVTHVGRGVALSGLGAEGWRSLLVAPRYLVWKLLLGFRRKPQAGEWVRTRREGEQQSGLQRRNDPPMKVLYLTTVYPGHKKTGGDVGSQRYIDALRRAGAEVDSVSFLRLGDAPPRQAWEHIAETRVIESAESFGKALLWLLRSVLFGTPYSAEKYRSSAYLRTVRRLCAEHDYRFCVLDHASRLTWVQSVLPRGLPVVANTHNIEHRLYERLAESSASFARRLVYRREAWLVQRIERRLVRTVQEIWTVTREDGDYFSALPDAPRVRAFETPPGDFSLPTVPPSKRYDVGLLGNWAWVSNREGLEWFAREALPHLPDGLVVELAGKGADWLVGAHPQLTVRGFVPDAVEFLAEARVIAVPSVSGAGVQVKTLDSIALGIPVVATSFAVRGIRALPSTVVVEDDPARFCACLAELAARGAAPPDAAAIAWADALRSQYRQGIAEALQALAQA